MKKSIMKKWVTVLRSGEFKQIQGKLETDKGNCCLGVLCNLALVEGICDFSMHNDFYISNMFDNVSGVLPGSVLKWSNVKHECGKFGKRSLVRMNDGGSTFLEIADAIEKNYKKL